MTAGIRADFCHINHCQKGFWGLNYVFSYIWFAFKLSAVFGWWPNQGERWGLFLQSFPPFNYHSGFSFEFLFNTEALVHGTVSSPLVEKKPSEYTHFSAACWWSAVPFSVTPVWSHLFPTEFNTMSEVTGVVHQSLRASLDMHDLYHRG